MSQKSEPPKHFATAAANLHRFKWNFTHTRLHLFLSSTSNFIRIPYSVYEMFNSFKLLVLKSMARNTLLRVRQQLLPAIRSVSGDFFTFQQESAQPTVPVRRLRYCQLWHPTSSAQWIGHQTGLNILTVLADINCDGNSWLVGNVIWKFIFQ